MVNVNHSVLEFCAGPKLTPELGPYPCLSDPTWLNPPHKVQMWHPNPTGGQDYIFVISSCMLVSKKFSYKEKNNSTVDVIFILLHCWPLIIGCVVSRYMLSTEHCTPTCNTWQELSQSYQTQAWSFMQPNTKHFVGTHWVQVRLLYSSYSEVRWSVVSLCIYCMCVYVLCLGGLSVLTVIFRSRKVSKLRLLEMKGEPFLVFRVIFNKWVKTRVKSGIHHKKNRVSIEIMFLVLTRTEIHVVCVCVYSALRFVDLW